MLLAAIAMVAASASAVMPDSVVSGIYSCGLNPCWGRNQLEWYGAAYAVPTLSAWAVVVAMSALAFVALRRI